MTLAACAAEAPPPAPAPRVALAVPVPSPPPPDPLGSQPVIPAAAAYVPPAPEVFTAKNGLTIWLLERHALPYVALAVAVPAGASSDAKNEGGLALATADMLDDGAGTRGATELSRAIDALGASLSTTANVDQSRVSMSVLKKNLAPAFALFADVVARPRFEPGEWTRLHEILVNDLTERQSDPDEVARVVMRRVLYGDAHPYGHPVEGTLASAKVWSLGDVQRFYKQAWRPDRATLVAVGDVTHAELAALVDESLGNWRAPKTPAAAPIAPAAPTGPWPKLVLVDRPDAPQSVIAVARPGLAASDPSTPVATRANVALGGAFTSRLNQDLRETHGYTYGASSRLSFSRGVGSFVASAAVMTDKTAEALKAMLGDIDGFSKNGLTDAEVDKTRSHARAELVETFEGVDTAAGQLAADAALGLGPDYERTAATRRDAAVKADLDALARAHFDVSGSVTVVVGPRAQLEGPLRALGYMDIELRDAEGNRVVPAPPPKSAKPK
jgi:predicted Zn-dependent peptidase